MGRLHLLRIGTGAIDVLPGDTVRVTDAVVSYKGPFLVAYLCWGLKKLNPFQPFQGFDNGNGLEGGPAAFGAAEVTFGAEALARQYRFTDLTADLTIPQIALRGVTYDTFVWLSRTRSPREVDFLPRAGGGGLIDTDAEVVHILSDAVSTKGEATDVTGGTRRL